MELEWNEDDEELDPETEASIDAALERARLTPESPHVVEAVFRTEPELQVLVLTLSDGRRLFVPREELLALRNATDQQARDIRILNPATAIYWPQLDDGLHVPEFIEHNWHPVDERLARPSVQSAPPKPHPLAA